MNYIGRLVKGLLILSVICVFFSSCKKDKDEYTANDELYLIMKHYYYWYNHVPDLNPDHYKDPFGLMNACVYHDVDRWSSVMYYDEYEQYFKAGQSEGYGAKFFLGGDGHIYVGYLYEDSPFYGFGIRRGWRLKSINEQEVTSSNFTDLINQASIQVTFSGVSGNDTTFSTDAKAVDMNTVLFHKVINNGGKKIGYLVLESFIDKTDDELDQVFALFGEENIDELILDLRYNGGGNLDEAIYLASSLAPDITQGEPFVKIQFNSKNSDLNEVEQFISSGHDLGLERIVVIASSSTASASEMIINGMKPYMDVTIIGDSTHGKPVGMNIIPYEEYAFVPVTFKYVNADNKGDFYEGIPANYYTDDEFYKTWGDSTENSLQAALEFIETGQVSSQKASKIMLRKNLTPTPFQPSAIKENNWKQNESY
ncbi:MAG: S41 family peptidase [Bacteroidota bacterium]